MNDLYMIDSDYWIKLIVAICCGTLIGLERQLSGKPIGIRTSTLVCLATMTFIDLSQMISDGGETARVLGQIVTGVGFLGAGVIMAREGVVVGVTSASVIWILAAVGAAIGMSRFGTALTTSIVTVCLLVGVQKLENAVASFRRGLYKRTRQSRPYKFRNDQDESESR